MHIDYFSSLLEAPEVRRLGLLLVLRRRHWVLRKGFKGKLGRLLRGVSVRLSMPLGQSSPDIPVAFIGRSLARASLHHAG